MRFSLFLVAMFSYTATAQLDFGDPGIEASRAGPVSIGAEAQTVYAAFPRDKRELVDLELEGHLTPALALSIDGSEMQRGLIAELSPIGGRMIVTRISVLDPLLKTREGIGVGSTVDEIRSKYEISGVAIGEGQLFVICDELSASFELDYSNYGFDTLRRLRDPNAIPADVKIVRVLLIG